MRNVLNFGGVMGDESTASYMGGGSIIVKVLLADVVVVVKEVGCHSSGQR